MRNTSATLGLTALLLTAPLLRTNALTVQIEVGPTNIKAQPYQFDITSKDRDGMKQFGVTITPKQGKLSPGLLARLRLFDGENAALATVPLAALATVPLEETRDGGKVTYWFQVAPRLLAKSRFEFAVLSGVQEKLPDGKTRFVAEPGTLEYYFNLRDFIAAKAARTPVSKGKRGVFRVGKAF